ncbi:MAG: hypothetical protein ACYC27_21050 [Armatimonadota bacterium]
MARTNATSSMSPISAFLVVGVVLLLMAGIIKDLSGNPSTTASDSIGVQSAVESSTAQ